MNFQPKFDSHRSVDASFVPPKAEKADAVPAPKPEPEVSGPTPDDDRRNRDVFLVIALASSRIERPQGLPAAIHDPTTA